MQLATKLIGLPSNNNPEPPATAQGFYLVWSPEAEGKVYRFDTLEEAQTNAEKFSKSFPHWSFYIAQTVSVDKTYMECVNVRLKTHFFHEEITTKRSKRSVN